MTPNMPFRGNSSSKAVEEAKAAEDAERQEEEKSQLVEEPTQAEAVETSAQCPGGPGGMEQGQTSGETPTTTTVEVWTTGHTSAHS